MSNQEVIKHLNVILGNELVAINQYFIHAKICQDQGFNKLAGINRAESIDEMKHADEIIERILFLKGIPNMNNYSKINVGATVPEMLKNDLDTELKAISDLKAAIKACEEAKDTGSKDMLEKILVSEEEHLDFLETNLGLIDSVGLENYLTTQIG